MSVGIWRPWVLVLTLAGVPSAAAAQRVIRGTVQDSATGLPARGLNVGLGLSPRVQTDSMGAFVVARAPAGPFAFSFCVPALPSGTPLGSESWTSGPVVHGGPPLCTVARNDDGPGRFRAHGYGGVPAAGPPDPRDAAGATP